MVTKHVDQSHGGTPEQYADDLVAEIKVRCSSVPLPPLCALSRCCCMYAQTGSFESVVASWLACSSTTEPLSARAEFEPGARLESELKAFARRADDATVTPLECPIVWARESNAFDCVSAPSIVHPFRTRDGHHLAR